MKDIRQFFECCTSSISEEVVINMEHKQRSQSCKTPNKRTFIKRSTPNYNITNQSAKKANSTIHSNKDKENIKINQIIPMYSSSRTNTSFDSSIHHFEKHIQNSKQSNNKQLHKFINYGNPKAKHSTSLLANLNPHIFQLYQPQQIPIALPKLLHDRRHKRQNQSVIYHQAYAYKGTQATGMKTILQTIEQRSSVPSMQESQMHQMRQISSKATIKSNIYENSSPFTHKYNSMVMKQSMSKQTFRMINSENLQDIDDGSLLAMVNKLQKDNQMLQRQLKALIEQQSHLILQKEFNKNRFHRQITFINRIKQQWQYKLNPYYPIIQT